MLRNQNIVKNSKSEPQQVFRQFAWNLAGTLTGTSGKTGTDKSQTTTPKRRARKKIQPKKKACPK